jgi:hypothetical protein
VGNQSSRKFPQFHTRENAGQHELLDWVTLAGAMTELGKKAEIIDYAETCLVNSNKCIAVFA